MMSVKQGNIGPARVLRKWERPEGVVVKLNIDGSFRPNELAGGWGYVNRYADAHVIQAGTGNSSRLQDAFHAEVLATVKGVEAAAHRGMAHIHLESDLVMLVQALKEGNLQYAVTGVLVLEAKKIIASAFISF